MRSCTPGFIGYCELIEGVGEGGRGGEEGVGGGMEEGRVRRMDRSTLLCMSFFLRGAGVHDYPLTGSAVVVCLLFGASV